MARAVHVKLLLRVFRISCMFLAARPPRSMDRSGSCWGLAGSLADLHACMAPTSSTALDSLRCVGRADNQVPLPSIDLAFPSLCSTAVMPAQGSGLMQVVQSRLSKSSVWACLGRAWALAPPSDLATCAKIRGPQHATALNGLEACGLWLQLLTQATPAPGCFRPSVHTWNPEGSENCCSTTFGY